MIGSKLFRSTIRNLSITFNPGFTYQTYNPETKLIECEAIKANAVNYERRYICNSRVAFNKCVMAMQKDFPDIPKGVLKIGEETDDEIMFLRYSNGLIDTAIEAYNNHHNLVLRPDDFWYSIISQFSIYINRYGKDIGVNLVKDPNIKTNLEIVVDSREMLDPKNYQNLIPRMIKKIETQMIDQKFIKWLTPKFTTTTNEDTLIYQLITMTTLKRWFSYVMGGRCGFPKITLHGTAEDYKEMKKRILDLANYNSTNGFMERWMELLIPIVNNLIKTAEGNPNLQFWRQTIFDHSGSGEHHITGWLTAFTIFNGDGDWQDNQFPNYYRKTIDGVTYPIIDLDTQSIPKYIAYAPISFINNDTEPYWVKKGTVIAGQPFVKLVDKKTLMPKAVWGLLIHDEEADQIKSK